MRDREDLTTQNVVRALSAIEEGPLISDILEDRLSKTIYAMKELSRVWENEATAQSYEEDYHSNAENLLQAFHDAFDDIDLDGLIGYLSEWLERYKELKDWELPPGSKSG